MYKTARGVKTDTEIHLGRSKAIFLTLSYRRNRANYFDGPIKRSPFFCRRISSSKEQKKLRKYHVGWNIFKNSIWISYNLNKVKSLEHFTWSQKIMDVSIIRKIKYNKTFFNHFLCSCAKKIMKNWVYRISTEVFCQMCTQTPSVYFFVEVAIIFI